MAPTLAANSGVPYQVTRRELDERLQKISVIVIRVHGEFERDVRDDVRDDVLVARDVIVAGVVLVHLERASVVPCSTPTRPLIPPLRTSQDSRGFER